MFYFGVKCKVKDVDGLIVKSFIDESSGYFVFVRFGKLFDSL